MLIRTPFLLLAAALVVLTGAGMWSQGVQLTPGSFQINNENNDLVVSWQADREEALLGYELYRKTPFSNGFQSVRGGQSMVTAHGPGKPYKYRDTQVYKATSEQVDYRLEAVYVSGVREVLQTKSVNYTPTAVRRTWGSIKAMFQ